jgi:hypothetical protein
MYTTTRPNGRPLEGECIGSCFRTATKFTYYIYLATALAARSFSGTIGTSVSAEMHGFYIYKKVAARDLG